MKKILSIIGIGLFLLVGACSEQPVAPQNDDAAMLADKANDHYGINIIPPTATAHGKTYAEWSAEWWKWLWSVPVDMNPGLDATGESVGVNQSGPVWFLAPDYSGQWERTATIPTGKMLFIDLAGFFLTISMGDGADEAELRANATFFLDAIVSNVIIEVDGVRLENVEDFRFASPPGLYGYTLPENNMIEWFGYDIDPGYYEDAVSEGYYAMLPPLSAGEHTIFLSADFGEPYNDIIQVTYNLTVKGGRGHAHMKK